MATFRGTPTANAEVQIGSEGSIGKAWVRRVFRLPSARHGSLAFAVGTLRDLLKTTLEGSWVGDVGSAVDVRVPQPSFGGRAWSRIAPLLSYLVTPPTFQWVERYCGGIGLGCRCGPEPRLGAMQLAMQLPYTTITVVVSSRCVIVTNTFM